MNNILVTGGAGFIGSNFINLLFQKYKTTFDTIVCIDNLTYAGNLQNIEPNKLSTFHFKQCDINDKEQIISIIEHYSINIIINFAAETHVDNSIAKSDIFVKTNVLGAHSLFDCAKHCWQNNYSNKKFVQVSTDEVYGSLSENVALKFTESSPLYPHSPYSASKASADLLALSYYHTFGFPVIVTRCSNNYGKQQHTEKFIPLIITNALQNKPLPVYGDGLNVRDWIYVEDHCQALLKVIKNGKIGEVYNIGANCEKTNLEVVDIILKALNKPKTLLKFIKDRPGHDRRYAIDANKIMAELNWQPKNNFETNIQTTIEWYRRACFTGNQFPAKYRKNLIEL